MILIFLGPPGAGKGTQAKYIADKLNLPHLSTGEILRQEQLRKTKISKEIKSIIDTGRLVSDQILNSIVSERIELDDCNKGFILDGYPRTMNQAIYLNDFLEKKNLIVNLILNLTIDEGTIIKRIKKRSKIEKREDDSEQVIKTRIFKYYDETSPLSEFYSKKYSSNFLNIDGNMEISDLNQKLLKIIENHAIS